jgi:ABC-type transporter Mla subunit MlaD
VPLLKYYSIKAQFTNASQIADLSEVRMNGRHIGEVTGSGLQGGHAMVRLQLFPGRGPLRADSTARIRLKGLLGAKFVDITPGRSGPTLPSGSTLPVSQTSSAVELLTVLQAFDEPTRARLAASVQGLGQGFLGRGMDLNNMFGVAPGFFGGARTVSESILARQGAAARFAPSTESLAAAYDPVREELAAGFAPEARVLQAFVDERPALQRTLVEAPPSLDALRQGLDAATPLLDQTAGLARATIRITRPAPAALREASVFLHGTAPALRATRPLVANLASAVPSTLTFLHAVDPVIDPAARALRNNVPPLLELGRHGCDVLSFARNWRSTLGFGVATGTGDPLGTLATGEPGLGPLNSLRVLAVRTLEPESLSADNPPGLGNIGRNAYPVPCAATSERLR